VSDPQACAAAIASENCSGTVRRLELSGEAGKHTFLALMENWGPRMVAADLVGICVFLAATLMDTLLRHRYFWVDGFPSTES
jgi:hypothetical protein